MNQNLFLSVNPMMNNMTPINQINQMNMSMNNMNLNSMNNNMNKPMNTCYNMN